MQTSLEKLALWPLWLAVVTGRVAGQAVEDEDLAPLGALIKGCQEFINRLRIQVQKVAVRMRLWYLRQSRYCICHHLMKKKYK